MRAVVAILALGLLAFWLYLDLDQLTETATGRIHVLTGSLFAVLIALRRKDALESFHVHPR